MLIWREGKGWKQETKNIHALVYPMVNYDICNPNRPDDESDDETHEHDHKHHGTGHHHSENER